LKCIYASSDQVPDKEDLLQKRTLGLEQNRNKEL